MTPIQKSNPSLCATKSSSHKPTDSIAEIREFMAVPPEDKIRLLMQAIEFLQAASTNRKDEKLNQAH